MTVPRGPPRRPTAGDPWAGARKSRARPRVHSECGESERTARLWERPALPRRRGCGACGVCGARRVLWGAQQGRESRGAEGARTRPRQGVCPAQGFRKGPKAQPSCRPLATGKVPAPHSLGSGEATLPQEPDSVRAQGAQRVSPTAPQRSILALACPRLSRPFPGWQLGRQRWGGWLSPPSAKHHLGATTPQPAPTV